MSEMLTQLVPKADESPFIVEQIAIDATNGLRAAEIGLRAFRSQPLLHRIWDSLRGRDRELSAAVGSDLITAQRATITLVKEIMAEEARTQYCVERVLHNLHAVNHDLDALINQTTQLDHLLRQEIVQLRKEFYEEIRQTAERLEEDIKRVDRKVEREATMRGLRDLFLSGSLHFGAGEIFGAALYLAQVARLFASEPINRVQRESKLALEVVKQKLQRTPKYIPELILHDVEHTQPDFLEALDYLSSKNSGPYLMVFHSLIERRMVNIRINQNVAEELVEIARKLHDPDHRLAPYYLRPCELAERVAIELLNIAPGGEV